MEIEAVVTSHPAVVEAAVVGVPDAVKGTVPIAFVTLAGGAPDPDGGAAVRSEIQRQVVAELGEGEYGVVLKAELATPGSSGAATAAKTVAVKRRGRSTEFGLADEALLVEGLLLHGLQHDRFVRLVAVVSTADPFMLCLEYMENGDLKTFLRRCRPGDHGPAPPAPAPAALGRGHRACTAAETS